MERASTRVRWERPRTSTHGASLTSRGFPPHYEMFCPFSECQIFLLFQRHILPVQTLNSKVEGNCSDLPLWRLKHERTAIAHHTNRNALLPTGAEPDLPRPKCQRSGSALSPPRGSKGNQATASDNYGRFEVKNVRTTFCTSVFSKPFTLVRCNRPKEQPIENSDSRVTVKNH